MRFRHSVLGQGWMSRRGGAREVDEEKEKTRPEEIQSASLTAVRGGGGGGGRKKGSVHHVEAGTLYSNLEDAQQPCDTCHTADLSATCDILTTFRKY